MSGERETEKEMLLHLVNINLVYCNIHQQNINRKRRAEENLHPLLDVAGKHSDKG